MNSQQLAIPERREALTVPWLNQALLLGGSPGLAPIKSFELDQAVAQGMKSDVVRLRLSYQDSSSSSPATLMLKLSARDPAMRERLQLRRNYLSEVQFYRQLQPQIDLPTPRCYYADVDFETGYHVLLLEDLAPAEVGNTLHGCPLDRAERAVRELARFHAHWWARRQLDDLGWLNDLPLVEPAQAQRNLDGWWPLFLEKAGHRLSGELAEFGGTLGGSFAALTNTLANSPPRTLRHGDYSLSNMMFGSASGGAPFTIIDWQTLSRGRGVWDLAWLLGQSMTIDQRRGSESQLLEGYHQGLMEGGVSDYSFRDCALDYRLALAQRFGTLISSIVALPFTESQKQHLIDVMLPRNLDAIDQHGGLTLFQLAGSNPV